MTQYPDCNYLTEKVFDHPENHLFLVNAVPKFKVGDMIRYRGDIYEITGIDGKMYNVDCIFWQDCDDIKTGIGTCQEDCMELIENLDLDTLNVSSAGLSDFETKLYKLVRLCDATCSSDSDLKECIRKHSKEIAESVDNKPNSNGVRLITKERERQINEKGWTKEHDQEHFMGELADAAVCYAFTENQRRQLWKMYVTGDKIPSVPPTWPFERKYWKPTPDDRVKELTKAGALIAAEIDRLIYQDEVRKFKEEHCRGCGSQRCTHNAEWLEGCPEFVKFMREVESNKD